MAYYQRIIDGVEAHEMELPLNFFSVLLHCVTAHPDEVDFIRDPRFRTFFAHRPTPPEKLETIDDLLVQPRPDWGYSPLDDVVMRFSLIRRLLNNGVDVELPIVGLCQWCIRPVYGYEAMRVLLDMLGKLPVTEEEVRPLTWLISATPATGSFQLTYKLLRRLSKRHPTSLPLICEYVAWLCFIVTARPVEICKRAAHRARKILLAAPVDFKVDTLEAVQQLLERADCALRAYPAGLPWADYLHGRVYGKLAIGILGWRYQASLPIGLSIHWKRLVSLEELRLCPDICFRMENIMGAPTPGSAPVRNALIFTAYLPDPDLAPAAMEVVQTVLTKSTRPAISTKSYLARLGTQFVEKIPVEKPVKELLLSKQRTTGPRKGAAVGACTLHFVVEVGGPIESPMKAGWATIKSFWREVSRPIKVDFYWPGETVAWARGQFTVMTSVAEMLRQIDRPGHLCLASGKPICSDVLLGGLFDIGIRGRNVVDYHVEIDTEHVRTGLRIVTIRKSWEGRNPILSGAWATALSVCGDLGDRYANLPVNETLSIEMRILLSNPLVGGFVGVWQVVDRYPRLFAADLRLAGVMLLAMPARLRLRGWEALHREARRIVDDTCSLHLGEETAMQYLHAEGEEWVLTIKETATPRERSMATKTYLHHLGNLMALCFRHGCGLGRVTPLSAAIIGAPEFRDSFEKVLPNNHLFAWFSTEELTVLLPQQHAWYPLEVEE
jgi:hypothetical protein